MKNLRIVFMGSPDFAIPGLDIIYKNFSISGCFTQPSRPSGRGQKIIDSPVKKFCKKNNISVYTPENFKSENNINLLKKLNPDILVVAAYGIILPKNILDIPKLESLNIHASLLPRWRGAAPIQHAILSGDKVTGITIMKMTEQLDAGNIVLQKKIKIKDSNTSQDVHDNLAKLGGELISEVLTTIQKGNKISSNVQDESKATYASKITTQDAKINWSKNGKKILQQIRAFNPWPGAWFQINDQRIQIYDAAISSSNKKNTPGIIIDDKFSISCGENELLHPKVLQRSGKNKIDISSFLRGFNFSINTKIE